MAKRAFPYVVVILLPILTAAAVAAMARWLGGSPGVIMLLLPVVVSAYVGGRRCGVVATAVATVCGAYLLRGAHLRGEGDPLVVDVIRLGSLAVVGAAIAFVIGALHRARRQALASEQASRASEARFARMFGESPVAMSLSQLADGAVVAVNEAYATTFLTTREAIIGRAPGDVDIRFEPGQREALFKRLRRGEAIVDHEVVATVADGTCRTVNLSSQPLELDGVAYAMSTFIDLTDHHRARAAAVASEAQLRELADAIPEVFWLSTLDQTQVVYVSPAYARIFGRPVERLLARAEDWLDAVHPDDRARMRVQSQSPIAGMRSDEYRIVKPDGAIRTIRSRMFPVRDPAGNLTRIAGIAEDITERLELEEQLRQTQKLESLGLLAGGVAHDFNNILAVIAANISILGDTPGIERELVDEVDSAVVRASSLTRQLLAFSRKQVVEPVVLDLNVAVNDTRKMLRRMIGEDIVLTTSLEPELGHVRIDPGYLVQVLMNLVVNARDAMPHGGTLTLATRTVGDQAMLEVTDTGCGMAEEVRSHVFEPFFTTKGVARGTGLGLSVVHGIVEQAGGRIEVESALELGTTFRIFLPRVDAPVEPLASVAEAGAHGSEKIMLVDDDRFVRTSTSRALRARGYTVVEAEDARHALHLLGDRCDAIDLLVTDIVMPGMDGRELVTQARVRRPTLKVLYISGYTEDALSRHEPLPADISVVEKPYRNHALAGRVRKILDAR